MLVVPCGANCDLKFVACANSESRPVLAALPTDAFHTDLWESVKRVAVEICYTDVFERAWRVSTAHLGTSLKWTEVKKCHDQPATADF